MRSRCCVCVPVYPPIVARQRLGKSPFIVARQRLGRNLLIVVRQRFGKNPPIMLGNGSVKIPLAPNTQTVKQ
jgi:hypothetical protein